MNTPKKEIQRANKTWVNPGWDPSSEHAALHFLKFILIYFRVGKRWKTLQHLCRLPQRDHRRELAVQVGRGLPQEKRRKFSRGFPNRQKLPAAPAGKCDPGGFGGLGTSPARGCLSPSHTRVMCGSLGDARQSPA